MHIIHKASSPYVRHIGVKNAKSRLESKKRTFWAAFSYKVPWVPETITYIREWRNLN